jgi:hypothetical protein
MKSLRLKKLGLNEINYNDFVYINGGKVLASDNTDIVSTSKDCYSDDVGSSAGDCVRDDC